MSTFAKETFFLPQSSPATAFCYFAATLVSGLALACAGIFWGRRIALHAAGRGA